MWNEKYAVDHYLYGTDPNDFLREHAGRLPIGDILSIGDGEGRNSVYLATRGQNVTAVDGSSVALAKAHRLAAEHGVSVGFIEADLADYAIEAAAWDGVVSIFCHVPPDLRRSLHGRLAAGLKPGGVLILEAYTPAQIGKGTGGPPVAEMTMSAETLRAEFPGIEFERLVELEREVIEGSGHTGTGAVVQAIGIRR